MEIQSLSVVVPTHGCINQCKFCVSRMHREEYENIIGRLITEKENESDRYLLQYMNRLAFARDNGCNTAMLTGSGEPQQNMPFLRFFGEINEKIYRPFRNIEIQTTGARFNREMLAEISDKVGVTTVSISVSCLTNDSVNSEIINNGHTPIHLRNLCEDIKSFGMNLRLSLNVTKHLVEDANPSYARVFDICRDYGADQVTFRKMFVNDKETPQGIWIRENELDHTEQWFEGLNQYICDNGHYLNELEYGCSRYSVKEMSTVVDTDCMSKEKGKKVLKYLILRPNCKLYTQWDDKGSLLF